MKTWSSLYVLLAAVILSNDSPGQVVTIRRGQAIAVPAAQLRSMPAEAHTQLIAQGQLSDGQAIESGGSSTPAPPQGGPTKSAQRGQAMQKRLQKLAKINFNRLPSKMLETWSKPAFNSKTDPNADLPPAPPEAFLYSDVRFNRETERLQRDFTLGNWPQIANFLKRLPEANAKSLYNQILQSATGAGDRKLQGAENGSRFDPRQLQSQFMPFEDLFTIAKIAPDKIDKNHVRLFGLAFAKTIAQGNTSNDLVERFKQELNADQPVFTKRQVAKVLFQAGLPIPAGDFLPALETAEKENDHEALNLLSRHYLAIHQKEKEKKVLEQAWHVTQAILAAKNVEKDERKQALTRAVQLSSKVSENLGQKWLHDSFIARPETGMEVLGAIGADVAQSMKSNGTSAETRLARLKLQNDAVNALLEVSPEQAQKWQQQLNLLGQNWLREAEVSYALDRSTQLGPSMRRDMYGNIFYFDGDESMPFNRQSFNGRLAPIRTKELLDVRPSAPWLELISTTIKPKFDSLQAQLYLKVGEQDRALPFIEKLAEAYPEKAKELVDEFLNVWTRNHDPNSDRGRTNYYMYMYGFESRAESIPLTRSKQERNLKELAELVQRLQNLVDSDLDEELLAKAFFTCHSTAEVYQIESLESVFGPVEQMQPKTLASVTSRMRQNLAGLWRDANVQKDKKTKRKKKDIEAAVIDGYETAAKIIDDALAKNPNEWKLVRIRAALLHDENNYRADLANSSEFSPRRKKSLEMFRTAAEMYVREIEQLEEQDYSTAAFETWFYAGLGACDLGLITEKHQADPKQSALIRATLEALPEEPRQWHTDRFANLLFNRLSSVKPQLKFKYLDKGFEIVGDNEQAAEARKVHEYYRDLVTEIRLESQIEGSDRVGNGTPFGVLVTLRHTQEIERESGGFGRYLQNQNSNQYFSYNYGRPTEDYRDKFDEHVREAFAEQFDVLSVTFQEPDVQSLPTGEPGWRVTPYAYVLLKARGPEVDKVPPFKLDLDFLDTSGYAVLPVESPTIPIDASSEAAEARPYENLAITEILDERQSSDGKLILEIKAQAQGLVPDLKDIMNVAPENFEVTSVDDEGVSVAQFDKEETIPTVISERNWIVSLESMSGLPEKPKSFAFPEPEVDLKEVVYQRYVDADLATVTPLIRLEEEYGKTDYRKLGLIFAVGFVLLFFVIGLVAWLVSHFRRPKVQTKMEVHENLSPFAAISILQEIYSNNGLSESKRGELKLAIDRMEEYYFGESPREEAPDLNSEVNRWTRQSRVAMNR